VPGEGFAVAFFLTAAVAVLGSIHRDSLPLAVIGGVLLAAAAYFRSQYELLTLFLTIVAFPLGAALWFRATKTSNRGRSGAFLRMTVRTMAATLLTAHLLMAPWRMHNYLDSGELSWVHTQKLVIANALTPTTELLKKNAKFVVEGGGDLACRFEPQYCGQTDPVLFYKAFVDNIGDWYQAKLRLVDDYWFSSVENLGRIVYPSHLLDKLINSMLLAFVLATVPLFLRVRRHFLAPALAWLCLSFYACFFCIFTLVQFEVRYFYLVKAFATFTTIVMSSMAYSMSRGGEISPRMRLDRANPV
jgi:hypothetical protein